MQHWYVYYKLPRAQVAATAARVRAMLDAVAASTSVRGRLLRRADDDADTLTLMEQYDHIADPQSFGAGLAQAVNNAGLPAGVIAQRRLERFEEF